MKRMILIFIIIILPSICIAESSCDKKYTAFYINGMFTPPDLSLLNVAKLKEKLANEFPDGSYTNFVSLYNSDGFSQFSEVLYQKLNENGLSDSIISRYFFLSLYAPDALDPLTQIVTDTSISTLVSGRTVEDQTYNEIKEKFIQRSDYEKSDYQFVFAHSQGNFYANKLLGDSSVRTGRSIGLMGIAVPSDDVEASYNGKKYYVTAHEDKVVNGVRLVFGDTLPGNVNIVDPNSDGLVHALIDSYLQDQSSLSELRMKLSDVVLDEACDLPILEEYIYWVINGRLVVADNINSFELPGDSKYAHRLLLDAGTRNMDSIRIDVTLPENASNLDIEPRISYDINVDDEFRNFYLGSSLTEGSVINYTPSSWRASEYRSGSGEVSAGKVLFSHSMSGREVIGCDRIDGECHKYSVKYRVVTTGEFDVMVGQDLAGGIFTSNKVTGGFKTVWDCVTEEPRTKGEYSGNCPR